MFEVTVPQDFPPLIGVTQWWDEEKLANLPKKTETATEYLVTLYLTAYNKIRLYLVIPEGDIADGTVDEGIRRKLGGWPRRLEERHGAAVNTTN